MRSLGLMTVLDLEYSNVGGPKNMGPLRSLERDGRVELTILFHRTVRDHCLRVV